MCLSALEKKKKEKNQGTLAWIPWRRGAQTYTYRARKNESERETLFARERERERERERGLFCHTEREREREKESEPRINNRGLWRGLRGDGALV